MSKPGAGMGRGDPISIQVGPLEACLQQPHTSPPAALRDSHLSPQPIPLLCLFTSNKTGPQAESWKTAISVLRNEGLCGVPSPVSSKRIQQLGNHPTFSSNTGTQTSLFQHLYY